MDNIDKFYIEELKGTYIEGKWYKFIEVPFKIDSSFIAKMYVCKKRKYIELSNSNIHAQLTGKPQWKYMSFKLNKTSWLIKYYLETLHYIPEFLRKDHRPEQLKLKLSIKED